MFMGPNTVHPHMAMAITIALLVVMILLQINPRLDGCIRGWNLMNQGALGVKEVIQEKQSKHCLVSVQEGSYYPGGGVAQIYVNYTDDTSADGDWSVNVTLNIRSSTSTGVMFALVKEETVPLALAIEDQSLDIVQDIIISIQSITVARLTTKRICTDKNLSIGFTATKSAVEITSNSYTEINYIDKEEMKKQLVILDQSMKGPVDTYLGGIPDIPVTATPVSAFYVGCMDITINGKLVDLDDALLKQNDIRSHSCPFIS